MTTLDIFQIIFICIVVCVGIGMFVKFAFFDDKNS